MKRYVQFCQDAIPMSKRLSLPALNQKSEYCILFIETRELPHFEFIIRYSLHNCENNMYRIVFITSHSVHKYYKKLFKTIKLKVDFIFIDNINNKEDYNNLLSSVEFYKKLQDLSIKKIVIIQNDALVLRKGIKDFLKYDYVGAPWPLEWHTSPLCFGNGGFSIRDVNVCMDMLLKYKNSSWIHKLKKRYGGSVPEDVFFANTIQVFSDNVPNFDQAREFSSEHLYNSNSIGCHQVWLGLPDERDFLLFWIRVLSKE